MNWELFFIMLFESFEKFLFEQHTIRKRVICLYLAGIEDHLGMVDPENGKDRSFLEDFVHYANIFLEGIEESNLPEFKKEVLAYLIDVKSQAERLLEGQERGAL
ncbi:MAG: hypothetical protein U5L10_03820 [Candidatus Moranbacteria bacterium]|nr:hypothetical protein [Candidatus Moranbacteria bacterium]